jgi:hypothetical protein
VVEREAAAPGVGLPAQFGALEPFGYPALQVNPHAVLDNLHVFFIGLFQSQAQAGPASAKPLNEDPQPNCLRLVAQASADLRHRLRHDLDQQVHPHRLCKRIPRTVYILLRGDQLVNTGA